jgi:hypothetical protein
MINVAREPVPYNTLNSIKPPSPHCHSLLISSTTSELAPSPWFVEIYVKDCILQPLLARHIIQRAGNSAEDVNSILLLKNCFVNIVECG